MSKPVFELERLIAGMDPVLEEGRWVFVSLSHGEYGDGREWRPLSATREPEGLSLVIEFEQADRAGLPHEGIFRSLLLRIHSSLQGVGLTAAVSGLLARHGIAANVIAGTFHDRVLVPEAQARQAMQLLQELAAGRGSM